MHTYLKKKSTRLFYSKNLECPELFLRKDKLIRGTIMINGRINKKVYYYNNIGLWFELTHPFILNCKGLERTKLHHLGRLVSLGMYGENTSRRNRGSPGILSSMKHSLSMNLN